MNSDKGSQFRSFARPHRLKRSAVKISIDGKGRCIDNFFIERLWRSLKHVCVYLHAWEAGSQAEAGFGRWMILQSPTAARRPWRATAGRGLLECLSN